MSRVHAFTDGSCNPRAIKGYLLARMVRNGTCWEWDGAVDKDGYGHSPRKFRAVGRFVHRLAYVAWKGEIPEGHVVCHTCDNPKCFNPSHLFTGTQLANMQDRDAKGHTARGERNGGGGKLTEEQVKEIKKLLPYCTDTAVARNFPVSRTMIYRIRKGLVWSEVDA